MAGLLTVVLIVMVATVAMVGRGLQLSSHNDLDASAHLTVSTDLATTTTTALVTSIGVHASLELTGYDSVGGVRVATCAPGGAAKRAGLRHGDLVVRIGHDAVRNLAGLDALMARLVPGQRVSIVALRNGATITVTAVLGRAP
jgi:S1-C subfamily serine protease